MKLVVINDYRHLAHEATDWSQLPPDVTMETHGRVDDTEAPVLLADADIIVTSREETRFDAALLERLPRLRLLVTHGTSNAALDLPALAARGVTVCGTRYGFEMATVELAWGLILGLAKQIMEENQAIRVGGWGAGLGRGLTGRRLGLIGLGRLGAGMAQVGQAMGMEVVAWSENLTAAHCEALGVRLVSRSQLFAESDVVSIHLRESARTRGLVGTAEIGAMRRDALLINTSRGTIVDEAALIDALQRGAIGGAGLDVFATEPLPPGHPLRGLPRTLLTSHVGGRTRENFHVRYQDSLDNVLAWLRGKPVRVIG